MHSRFSKLSCNSSGGNLFSKFEHPSIGVEPQEYFHIGRTSRRELNETSAGMRNLQTIEGQRCQDACPAAQTKAFPARIAVIYGCKRYDTALEALRIGRRAQPHPHTLLHPIRCPADLSPLKENTALRWRYPVVPWSIVHSMLRTSRAVAITVNIRTPRTGGIARLPLSRQSRPALWPRSLPSA